MLVVAFLIVAVFLYTFDSWIVVGALREFEVKWLGQKTCVVKFIFDFDSLIKFEQEVTSVSFCKLLKLFGI